MKPTSKAAAALFLISKISMIAATIISSRSVSTRFKAIRTLMLVILFAAGVVANTDAGITRLRVVSSPQIAGQLNATAAIADNDIWAVGFSDEVSAPPVVDSTLAEHFNGKSWSIVSTPALPSGGVNPPNAQFFGVAAVSSNDVWAVGIKTGPDNPDFGEQLIEHWNGASWSVDTTGPTI